MDNKKTTSASYWLYDWIDEVGVTTPEQVNRALAGRSSLERVAEQAIVAVKRGQSAKMSVPDSAVVAGRQIDLSGILSCSNAGCIIAGIDKLGTAWHYFDHVVVEGLAPSRFLRSFSENPDIAQAAFLNHVHVALHLRKMQANRYLQFVEKPYGFCVAHYQQHAQELGLEAAYDEELASKVIAYLEADGQIEERTVTDDLVSFTFSHPALSGMPTAFHRKSANFVKPDLGEMARVVYESYCLAAVGDFALARTLHRPIASSVRGILDSEGLGNNFESNKEPRSPDAVALSMRVPVLTGMSTADFLHFREDNHAEFELYRAGLRRAIQDALSLDPAMSATDIARNVVIEHISPAMADLEVRLKSSRRAFAKKSLQNAGVGTLLTTVGLLGAMPLLVGAGVAAFGTSVTHANRYVDEKKELEASDMYFLWHASRSSHNHN